MSDSIDALEFPRSDARVWTLSNGLELIVKEDHSAPVVSLQAWCRAGSIHEGPWLGAGMSHYLEHMLFKGTGKRDACEVAQAVQEQGGYINAYTSFDRTVYWIDAPTSGAETCLEILCDVVGDAQIPEDEFEKERDVIRREISMGEDNPDQVLSKMLFRTAYADHPVRFPVIGHLELFNQLSRDDLYNYYREKYSPDNLFIVVAGDVDGEKIREQVEEYLGGLERRRGGSPVLPDERRQIGIRKDEREFPTDLHRLRLAWPTVDTTHEDVPALDLLGTILGGGRSSRLIQEVKENRQLAHSISSYSYTPAFSGLFMVSCDTDSERTGEAEIAIFEELEKVKLDGVSEAELEKVKRQALSSQFSTLTDVRGQASDLGSNWLTTRNLDLTRDYVRDIQSVSCSDIQAVAQKYLSADTFTRVSLAPAGQEKKVQSGGTGKRSEDFRRVELENGMTVLLLADHRVPFVQANGVFRGGLLAESPEKNGITRLMGRLLTKDTANRTSEEVADAIESVGGGISGSFGNNSFGVSSGAMRTDLDLVVDLLGDALIRPSFLEEVVEKEKGFQMAGIKAEKDRPFSVAIKQLRREIYGDHPYGLEGSGTEETVGNITREDLVGFRDRLVKGGNGVLGVFGDLDIDRTEELVRAKFEGDMQSGEREFTGARNFSLPEKYGQTVELKHEKEQAILLVGFRTVDLTHPDNPALEMIDEACSDMASRMFIRIREELGLAYSVGASRIQGLEPGSLLFYVSTAPEKLDLVQSNLLDEIYKIPSEGLEEQEFKRAQSSWLGREAIHLQGARELANVATIDELVGLGWDNYRKAPDEMKSLTLEEIQTVAAKYIREENQVIVRLTQ